MAEGPPKVMVDSRPLMAALAKMANMEWSGIRRMVLELDIYKAPKLYVESFLDSRNEINLPATELAAEEGPILVSLEETQVFVKPVSDPDRQHSDALQNYIDDMKRQLGLSGGIPTTTVHNQHFKTVHPRCPAATSLGQCQLPEGHTGDHCA